MKYQLRLVDCTLPDYSRQLAQACWNAADVMLPELPPPLLYRALSRAVRGVLKGHLSAHRYCGATSGCDRSIPSSVLHGEPSPQAYAGERIRVFTMEPAWTPDAMVRELVRQALTALVPYVPKSSLKGIAPAVERQIRKRVEPRLFKAEDCGDLPICEANEAYDPWDAEEELNRPAKHA